MQNNIKNNILELIDIKKRENELVEVIYNSSNDVKICIFSEEPLTIFVTNPLGFETLAKAFKKRIITSDEKVKGEYPIKKYFVFKDVEFFCLYKDGSKKKKFKLEKWAKVINVIFTALKAIVAFAVAIGKIIVKFI